jgi:hypothetical protein
MTLLESVRISSTSQNDVCQMDAPVRVPIQHVEVLVGLGGDDVLVHGGQVLRAAHKKTCLQLLVSGDIVVLIKLVRIQRMNIVCFVVIKNNRSVVISRHVALVFSLHKSPDR